MSERVWLAQVEWLQPYTDAKIKELGASGVKQLLAVPISFVSEHIETLEEIDMEYRELAIESGIKVSSCGMLLSMQAYWLDLQYYHTFNAQQRQLRP
jgi:protoheme ferro-lyase